MLALYAILGIKKVKYLFSIALLCSSTLLIAGCSADMLVSPTDKYGPTSGDKIGRIKYLAEGASSVIESRRKDALKKMYDACNGRYKILDETSKDKVIGLSEYSAFKGSAFIGSSEYVYIKFQCEK